MCGPVNAHGSAYLCVLLSSQAHTCRLAEPPVVSGSGVISSESPSLGEPVRGLLEVCPADPAGTGARWLSHGALGSGESFCLSWPGRKLLPPCICGNSKLDHLKNYTLTSGQGNLSRV